MVEDRRGDAVDLERMLDLATPWCLHVAMSAPASRPTRGCSAGTLTEFTDLARRAGLDVVAAGTQASGRFVVECRPAS